MRLYSTISMFSLYAEVLLFVSCMASFRGFSVNPFNLCIESYKQGEWKRKHYFRWGRKLKFIVIKKYGQILFKTEKKDCFGKFRAVLLC